MNGGEWVVHTLAAIATLFHQSPSQKLQIHARQLLIDDIYLAWEKQQAICL